GIEKIDLAPGDANNILDPGAFDDLELGARNSRGEIACHVQRDVLERGVLKNERWRDDGGCGSAGVERTPYVGVLEEIGADAGTDVLAVAKGCIAAGNAGDEPDRLRC